MTEHYEIRIMGRLDPHWSEWFSGLSLTYTAENETLLAGLTWTSHRYEMGEDRLKGVEVDETYSYLLPRLGLTFRPGPGWSLFANVSRGGREPAFRDIYDPQSYWTPPRTDPDDYWQTYNDVTPPYDEVVPEFCAGFPAVSNTPDGNLVEKGGQGYTLRGLPTAPSISRNLMIRSERYDKASDLEQARMGLRLPAQPAAQQVWALRLPRQRALQRQELQQRGPQRRGLRPGSRITTSRPG